MSTFFFFFLSTLQGTLYLLLYRVVLSFRLDSGWPLSKTLWLRIARARELGYDTVPAIIQNWASLKLGQCLMSEFRPFNNQIVQ